MHHEESREVAHVLTMGGGEAVPATQAFFSGRTGSCQGRACKKWCKIEWINKMSTRVDGKELWGREKGQTWGSLLFYKSFEEPVEPLAGELTSPHVNDEEVASDNCERCVGCLR